jgi:colanic acid/amylovoran biosynthesis glycosyltransferase
VKKLLVIAPITACVTGDGIYLDSKFVEGMRFYSERWEGKVASVFRTSGQRLPFDGLFTETDLPFEVNLWKQDHAFSAELIQQFDIVLCSGDIPDHSKIARICADTTTKAVFIIEYIPETRHQIVKLSHRSFSPKAIYQFAKLAIEERARQKAFKMAAGVQCNGYPAYDFYRDLGGNTILYLDSRMSRDLMGDEDQLAARESYLASGRPIRILHSGRLEPMKGSQDIIPIARKLVKLEVDFRIDIFGAGSLEDMISNDIARFNLQDRITMHGVADFSTQLVPFAKQHSDVFLSCNRQSDPSCTYLESMGCGLPIVGYDNRMWSALCADSQAGLIAPMGDHDEAAKIISRLKKDLALMSTLSRNALSFAKKHDFECEFEKRISQIGSLANKAAAVARS